MTAQGENSNKTYMTLVMISNDWDEVPYYTVATDNADEISRLRLVGESKGLVVTTRRASSVDQAIKFLNQFPNSSDL